MYSRDVARDWRNKILGMNLNNGRLNGWPIVVVENGDGLSFFLEFGCDFVIGKYGPRADNAAEDGMLISRIE